MISKTMNDSFSSRLRNMPYIFLLLLPVLTLISDLLTDQWTDYIDCVLIYHDIIQKNNDPFTNQNKNIELNSFCIRYQLIVNAMPIYLFIIMSICCLSLAFKGHIRLTILYHSF